MYFIQFIIKDSVFFILLYKLLLFKFYFAVVGCKYTEIHLIVCVALCPGTLLASLYPAEQVPFFVLVFLEFL